MNHSIPSSCHTASEIHQQPMSEHGQSCFQKRSNGLPSSVMGVKQLVIFFFLGSSFLSPHGTTELIQSAFESYKGLENMNMKQKRKATAQDRE